MKNTKKNHQGNQIERFPEGFGSGVVFSASYHQHDVTLTVTAVPEPEQYLMLLAGLGLLGAMARRRRI